MPTNNPLKISIAQLNFTVGDIDANKKLIIQSVEEAYENHADIILFPELALCSYPPEDLLYRPRFHFHIQRALNDIVASIKGIHVLLGHPVKQSEKLFNACSLIHSGKILLTYFKQHLPNYGVFDEKRYFQSGQETGLFEINGIKAAISICEDIWVPKPTQDAAKKGAKILFNINASPYDRNKLVAREKMVMHRAKENEMSIVYANLVGGQDELIFDGNSMVVNEKGQTIFHSPPFESGLYHFGIRSNSSIQSRKELINEEETVYKALILGVKDYIEKNRFKGIVIGLSGGIDSALTLCIAVDALGADKVETVLMPSKYTAEMSNEDAIKQTETLGVRADIIAIEKPYDAFVEVLGSRFSGLENDLTEENIQARCRGLILMAISNKTGKLVLTTGNKSEMAVGYATLYGDMSGGFAPLKDVWKTMVYRLARWRNSISSVIPERVINRPPTAELRLDQLDQDSIPDYVILDPILEQYIEQDCYPEQIIAQGFDADEVYKVIALVDRNEYKRRQAAPGVRITGRAFGRDRRYPITSGYIEKE